VCVCVYVSTIRRGRKVPGQYRQFICNGSCCMCQWCLSCLSVCLFQLCVKCLKTRTHDTHVTCFVSYLTRYLSNLSFYVICHVTCYVMSRVMCPAVCACAVCVCLFQLCVMWMQDHTEIQKTHLICKVSWCVYLWRASVVQMCHVDVRTRLAWNVSSCVCLCRVSVSVSPMCDMLTKQEYNTHI